MKRWNSGLIERLIVSVKIASARTLGPSTSASGTWSTFTLAHR